jgi:hypothetical protein
MAAVHRSTASSLNEGRKSVMEASDRPTRRGNFGSNLDRTFKQERLRFNPRRDAVALDLPRWGHSRARWSPKRGLACATAFGFGRFRAQIKAGVEGSSPRGFSANDGHRKMACGGKD